eukprot:tig00000227_g19831.t1
MDRTAFLAPSPAGAAVRGCWPEAAGARARGAARASRATEAAAALSSRSFFGGACSFTAGRSAPAYAAGPAPRPFLVEATASSPSPGAKPTLLETVRNALSRSSDFFIPMLVAACAIAYVKPEFYAWVGAKELTRALATIMFSTGLGLKITDFAGVVRQPVPILTAFVLHYTLCPLLGLALGNLAGMDVGMKVGLILCACCPGGVAANLMTFIARGNVALSVMISACSYLGAAAMTPLLTKLLVGTLVPVNALQLAKSTLEVVLLPVFAGVALNQYVPKVVAAVKPVSPLVASLATCLCCGAALSQNKQALVSSGLKFIGSVFLLHVGAFLGGYQIAKALGSDRSTRRTISLNVGTISGALGVVLAKQPFLGPGF